MYKPIFPLENRQFNLCEPIPVLNDTQIHCNSKIHKSCPLFQILRRFIEILAILQYCTLNITKL